MNFTVPKTTRHLANRPARLKRHRLRVGRSAAMIFAIWGISVPAAAQSGLRSRTNVQSDSGDVVVSAQSVPVPPQTPRVLQMAAIDTYGDRDVLGNLTGTFAGNWNVAAQPTKGDGAFAQILAGNTGTLEWTLDGEGQWALNGQQASLVVQGWWRPNDVGTFSARVEYWDSLGGDGSGAWVSALTFTSDGVLVVPNPVPWANPPRLTKVRINVTSVTNYCRFTVVELFGINPYGWLKSSLSAQRLYGSTLGLGYNDPGTAALAVNGKVGIGTATPSSALHVVGDVTVNGNIAAKYQDVAEWVPARERISGGTVVVVDPKRPNHVLPSYQAYDTRVAGIVSEKPGLLLGEAGEGKVIIATGGRVKVRADASKGSIQIGDLLVTSDRRGVAMRSEPLDLGGMPIHRPGTLLGKALEPLQRGEGEILVLLSLQ